MILRVSGDGRVTIPAAVRSELGIKPRSHVRVEVSDDKIVISRVMSITEVAGVFREYAKGKTTDWDTIREETMRIVAQELLDEIQSP